MSTELQFDETTARALLQTAPKMKPRGMARAYKVDAPFKLFRLDEGQEAGGYLVLYPDGTIASETAETVERCFEPVAKRTITPKVEKGE